MKFITLIVLTMASFHSHSNTDKDYYCHNFDQGTYPKALVQLIDDKNILYRFQASIDSAETTVTGVIETVKDLDRVNNEKSYTGTMNKSSFRFYVRENNENAKQLQGWLEYQGSLMALDCE